MDAHVICINSNATLDIKNKMNNKHIFDEY